ncbi:dual specificity phosphatase [Nitzschia inconspicua]|uniref:protein-tyrosine-phosphatase n=1 Tax=Nitzschia inconspicua TaxID=303405 RepID=A0A9K3KER9_9STRA|nr:dual specificity phosphatase [Nitzschia inconspicua]
MSMETIEHGKILSDENDRKDHWINEIRAIVNEPIPPDLPEPPVEVLPWLYLGPRRCLNDLSKLQLDIGITHVLSMNAMQPESVAQELYYTRLSEGIEHCYVPALDILGYPLLPKHWDECHEFLQPVMEDYCRYVCWLNDGGGGGGDGDKCTIPSSFLNDEPQDSNNKEKCHSKVFVHCEAGINRSGTIVAAAMMHFAKIPMLDAIRQLKRQRGIIMTNATFQEQLVEFAKSSHGCFG